MTRQILSGGSTDSPSNSTVEYNVLDGAKLWQATEPGMGYLAASPGVLSHLRVAVVTAPGAGKSLTFAVMLNGVATSLSAAISGAAATSAEDTVNTVAVVAGDVLSLRCTPAGTPTVSAVRNASMFTHTVPSTAMSGTSTGSLPSTTLTHYNLIGLASEGWVWHATETARSTPWNIDATINALYVKVETAPGAGKSYAYTIMKNGVADVTSTVTIADAATTASVTGLAIDVAPGDFFSLRSVPSGTPTASIVTRGVSYLTDTDRQWNIIGKQFDGSEPPTAPGESFIWPSGSVRAFETGEDDMQQLGGAATGAGTFTTVSLRVQMTNAPGAGDTRTFTLRVNKASSSLAAAITETNETVLQAGAVLISPGDSIDYMHVETGTAAGPSTISFGLLVTASVPPAAGPGNSGNAPGRNRGNPNPGGGGGGGAGGGGGGGQGGGGQNQLKWGWPRRKARGR